MPALTSLGWDAARDAEFAPLRAAGLEPGRVCLEHNHVYRVLGAGGEVLAETSGRIRYLAEGRRELPAVGDWVAVRQDAKGNRSTIRAILQRRSYFSRKAAGRVTHEQVMAANVDLVFLVFGLDKPVNARAIERYLAMARKSGAEPVVVLNKADLSQSPSGAIEEAAAVSAGAAVRAISAKGNPGVTAIESYLREGRTVALLGPSGVGKSSIVNRLVGESLLETAEVREWDRRGRHTSVDRQLLLRPQGGLIIDTPGMRELQLWDADEGVAETFEEIAQLAAGCRFRDCRHDKEPGCAVKAAVESGELPADRYQGYLKLAHEQVALDKLKDERAILEAKRTTKSIHKAYRAIQKAKGR